MRPESIDDVLLAYHAALRALHAKQDHLRNAATEVARLQCELKDQDRIVRELRNEVVSFGVEVAA